MGRGRTFKGEVSSQADGNRAGERASLMVEERGHCRREALEGGLRWGPEAHRP